MPQAPPRRPFCGSAGGSGCRAIRRSGWHWPRSRRSPGARAAPITDISADDSIDDIIAKVAYGDASAVEETAGQLDRTALGDAAKAVASAGRVEIYGIAASFTVSSDLQQKLHRIGVHATCTADPHRALPGVTLLRPGDVAIGISHSGTTAETIEVLSAARRKGATTVAITNFPMSLLARQADLTLTTAARETTLRSGATASRIAALTVVDCLHRRRPTESGTGPSRRQRNPAIGGGAPLGGLTARR